MFGSNECEMSKENNNLRLLGSPVNLTYRNKKKDAGKLIRNRPRSALQNSCFTPENPERFKRPFSADAKERGPTTRNLLKAFSAELLESYNNSPESAITVKVLPPTTELLGDRNFPDQTSQKKDKDICSNASDYGSEDTYISLGTKIKAKAQISPKPKNTNSKNFIKYRNIAKKNRRAMETPIKEDTNNEYNLEIKITEKERSPSPQRNKNMYNERSFSPTTKTRPYESYFIPLEGERKEDESLLGRVSFGYNIQEEVEQAIDTYSRRLTVTKQQLSLVEEESTQDIDSAPSQNSISPEMSLDDAKNTKDDGDSYRVESYAVGNKVLNHNFMCEPRTYASFYDDFRSNSTDPYKPKMSSTAIHTDTSSKDSGYPDSGPNDDRAHKHNYSLPSTSMMKKSGSHSNVEDQPRSLDSASSSSNGQEYKTFPMDRKEQWAEPLNHSRLLYKDFFLKKEGHVALPPNNSPTKSVESYPVPSEVADEIVPVSGTNSGYPSYLKNSTTKAYTSKVIEDYKKELEAINSLHELTLKDIKTDAISPTPLNIDKMFEDNSSHLNDAVKDSTQNSPQSSTSTEPTNNKTSFEMKQRRDIAKISTKELIQNYLKVKEGDINDFIQKTNQKKVNNVPTKYENIQPRYRQDWNNKSSLGIVKSKTQVNIRNPTQKNMFTMRPPLSARIDGVTNDKDIDSWMSLSAPSPRILEMDNIPDEQIQTSPNIIEPSVEENKVGSQKSPSPRFAVEKEIKSKDLNSNSTVLDIYSMLKEIESYGDNPVTTVSNLETNKTEDHEEEDGNTTPKDNFMEIFKFLEKVEQSANDALSVVTSSTPQTIPNLQTLLKLPQTELAQRLVTASLQLEERSCCIALLQESLTNHKEQMLHKMSNLEKQSIRNVTKVKQDCEETIKRHQNFIDQLINDKKTLNHRIEQLVDERRSLEERWKRAAQSLEERYKLELRNQHDKMAAAQQVARQRWVRQKAEKIKELTVKGLEGELRDMAERQQKEVSDLKMHHAEQLGRNQVKHAQELEELRRTLEAEKEAALVKERQLASSRLEKQILELELTYQEQRTRLVAEMRAENERAATGLSEREKVQRQEIEKWRQQQDDLLAEKKAEMNREIVKQKEELEVQLHQKKLDLEAQFEQFKKEFEAEQNLTLKRKVAEISAQHKVERDREIEKAIESMEAEAQAGRKELQDAMRRNKEQYEAELKELAETEQATLRRYQDVQARVRQTEDKCAEFEVNVSQLETRNRVLTEKNIQLESRCDEIRSQIELAWSNKVDALQKDIEVLKKTHEEQMHQLYAKVKVAVARKDSAIQALTREAAKYHEKIAILEQKLQQQRKDFLKHK